MIIDHIIFPLEMFSIFSSRFCGLSTVYRQLNLTGNRNAVQTITTHVPTNESDDVRASRQRQQNDNDKLRQEFESNRIETSSFQRLILSAGSSVAALINPHRHDMIACLGETTGVKSLQRTLDTMKASDEGTQILLDKPRINTTTVDIDALGCLPIDTLGFSYKKFLDDNKVTPDSRMQVKFISDPELMYVMTRYRECHDLVHTVLGMPTNMLGEVSVKWIEAINIGLPMCYGGAIFGAMRLRPKQRANYRQHYLPWALSTSKVLKPLMNVYWEKRWTQNINELRKELNITPLHLDATSK